MPSFMIVFMLLLYLGALIVTYRVSRNKGYPGLLFAILQIFIPCMIIVAFVLPDLNRASEDEPRSYAVDKQEKNKQKEEFKPAAKLSQKNATAAHVELYQRGLNAYNQREYFTALKCFEQVAQAGHVEAQMCCARMYLEGLYNIEQDYERALYWYEKAAAQGNAEAVEWVDILQDLGYSCSKDENWYENATEVGVKSEQQLEDEARDIKLTYIEGVKLYNTGIYSIALHSFRRAAQKGHMEAQMYCAQMYHDGQGCAVDYEQALYWYTQAAEQGLLLAQKNCAVMYSNGEGCTPDPEKVLYWYEKAAKQGDDDAQLRVGMAYNLGRGCMTDLKKARYWYEKAAAQGNANAKKLLSNMDD